MKKTIYFEIKRSTDIYKSKLTPNLFASRVSVGSGTKNIALSPVPARLLAA